MSLEPEKKNRKLERGVMLAIVLVILLLFVFFLKDIMVPLLRMELRRDLDGARALLAERGVQGALTVVLVEALQMVVVFVPAEFTANYFGLSCYIHPDAANVRISDSRATFPDVFLAGQFSSSAR